MNKLAIDGGIPVFTNEERAKIVPVWPIPHKETEEKLLDIFRTGNWCSGQYEEKLMTEFAAFQDCKYSAWMNNGTVTLECALLTLGIGRGDEVIVPGITWIATPEAALYVGATPVIIDVDPETLCMDPAKIEEAITPRTKAIIPVHIYSAISDMDAINAIAKKHGIHVIEDCAHSHGAKQHGKGTGSHGEFGSFSFQHSKIMTGGEGGCLTTNDEHLADFALRFSHIGVSKLHPGERVPMGLLCHQYRFTEFQAAIIYDQLQHQAAYRAKRQASAAILRDVIKDIPSIHMQKSACEDDFRDYYFLSFLLKPEFLKEGIDRQQIANALWAEGVALGYGWGDPVYKSVVWSIPEDQYIKKNTDNCEDIMYKRLLCCRHNILLADEEIIRRWGEGLAKVMRACTK